jgi:hypothetical protein
VTPTTPAPDLSPAAQLARLRLASLTAVTARLLRDGPALARVGLPLLATPCPEHGIDVLAVPPAHLAACLALRGCGPWALVALLAAPPPAPCHVRVLFVAAGEVEHVDVEVLELAAINTTGGTA